MSFTSCCVNSYTRFGARRKDAANNEYRHGAVYSGPPAEGHSSVAGGL